MGGSLSIESLYQFQFTDLPDVYVYIARAQRGVLEEDFLRNIPEKYRIEWEDSEMYTRCFIKTPGGYMEKLLRHPGKDYTLDTSIKFVDDEEITINPEGSEGMYRYFFRNQTKTEGYIFVLKSVENIPDVEVMHEMFHTMSPMNHPIDQIYARILRKEPTIRNIEQVIRMEEAEKGGERPESTSETPPQGLVSLFENDTYKERSTEFIDGVARLRLHIGNQSSFGSSEESGATLDREKRAELVLIAVSVDGVLE